MSIEIYKPYLDNAKTYQGGKSKSEIKPGADLIKLSSNENLLGSSPMAIQAIRDSLDSLHEYPDGNAIRLCTALSDYYGERLDSNQIVCANSGSECLEMIIRAYLDEGLECIVSTPTFMPYVIFSKKLGVTVRDVQLSKDAFDLDVEGILSAVNENTRLLFLNNPNNPTGAYLGDAEVKGLLDRLPDHVVVVIDEVYRQFATADDFSEATKWVAAGYPVIGVNSLSKAYGLAGLRVGYLYANERIASYINKLSRPFFLSTLAINAGIAALKDTGYINATVDSVLSGRAYLLGEFDRLGLKCYPSQTNFILVKPEMGAEAFIVRLLDHDIMVRGVANFGADGCVRITVGKEEHNQALVKALQEIL